MKDYQKGTRIIFVVIKVRRIKWREGEWEARENIIKAQKKKTGTQT